MTTTRLYLREENTPATDDSVLLSPYPRAGAVLMANPGTALAPISLNIVFGWQDLDLSTNPGFEDEFPTFPCHRARGIVPQGWVAHIYALTLQTQGMGVNATTCSAELFAGTVLSGQPSVMASFGALTLTPTAQAQYASCEPTSPPYILTASDSAGVLDMRFTCDGNSGTISAVAYITGYMYKAP